MTKIDETTGLAAVPEDMFWRVAEMVLDTGERYKDVGGVRIDLIKKTTIEIPEQELHNWENNSLWKRIVTGEKRTKITETVPAESKTTEESLVYASLLKVVKTEPEDLTDWVKFKYDRYWDEVHTRYYKVIPATAENLRKNSILCWEHYLKQQHTAAIEEDGKRELSRVLGDYPPKSLKDLVDA